MLRRCTLWIAFATLTNACATTGATLGSGVGARPPV